MCKAVSAKAQDASFITEQCKKKNPLAVAALAGFVSEKIVRAQLIDEHFNGITFTVPATEDTSMCESPHCHALVGVKLPLVDWVQTHALEIKCPTCEEGVLQNDRTNFSKNELLFPICGLDGKTQWCMAMSMTCPHCKARHNANDGAVLARIPHCASSQCPVDSRFVLP